MPDFRKEKILLLSLALLKLFIHFLTNTNYGLHRDEYLYLEEANRLDWGFMEIPPVTPLLGKIAISIGGDSVFAIRFFPALIGSIMVWLIGKMVLELGGKWWAVLIACLTFVFTPAFLGTNTLFQPVSFNQFCWAVSAFLMIKIVKTGNVKYWYLLGIVGGIGFLTKYSIVFFYVAIFLGLLVTKERKWLKTKYPWIAVSIGLLIALPNLFWQHTYGWPVIHHMTDLAASQLVNVTPVHFLSSQLTRFWFSAFVWIPGLIWLFRRGTSYRFLAWTYLFTILILLFLNGKAYYAQGAYPMLFAAGGVALASYFKESQNWKKIAFLLFILLFNLIKIPTRLPVFKIENMASYYNFLSIFGYENRWEDGKIYPLSQDYADMFGWEEIAQKVAKIYHALPEEKKTSCQIYGGSYGHAGALNFYREKYDLPEAVSFNSSYKLWAPDDAHFTCQILVDDVVQNSSQWFHTMELVDSIEHPVARDPGYIYWREDPKINLDSMWVELVKEEKYWRN